MYLGPSPNHARSVALVLNPRTGHVSPQFHIKFDNFFKTVQDKLTDLDAPNPEWKYLGGVATKRGPAKEGAKGGLDGLLVPHRGATAAALPPQESTVTDSPTDLHQGLLLPLENDANGPDLPAPPPPVAPAALHQPQQELPNASARQTRSGRGHQEHPSL